MDNKSYSLDFKDFDDEAGTGSAVFATLETLDKDGDYTEKGAFGKQAVKLVGAHDWAAPPIGTGLIREDGKDAIVDFRFNLKMASGREWYESIKASHAAGVPQEFSYGFDILEKDVDGASEFGAQRILKSLDVFEVSPVMVGAGMNTRLLDVKSGKTMRMDEQFCAVVETIEEFMKRSEDLAALRQKEGKAAVSLVGHERLSALLVRVSELKASVEALLNPEDSADLSILEMELRLRESERRRRGLGG